LDIGGGCLPGHNQLYHIKPTSVARGREKIIYIKVTFTYIKVTSVKNFIYTKITFTYIKVTFTYIKVTSVKNFIYIKVTFTYIKVTEKLYT